MLEPTDAEVEAEAREMFDLDTCQHGGLPEEQPWDDAKAVHQGLWIDQARASLRRSRARQAAPRVERKVCWIYGPLSPDEVQAFDKLIAAGWRVERADDLPSARCAMVSLVR